MKNLEKIVVVFFFNHDISVVFEKFEIYNNNIIILTSKIKIKIGMIRSKKKKKMFVDTTLSILNYKKIKMKIKHLFLTI